MFSLYPLTTVVNRVILQVLMLKNTHMTGYIMSKPYIHAKNSARRFGGEPEDYFEIHDFMDSSKGAIADNRHRALTHNSWFLSNVLERVFGPTIINSAGREVSVRTIGEQHILEDFGMRFIPSAQDFLEGIPFKDWMNNGRGGSVPPSFSAIQDSKVNIKLD